jgi:phage shock protein PspC (stress-responsive transcriptional regulator)
MLNYVSHELANKVYHLTKALETSQKIIKSLEEENSSLKETLDFLKEKDESLMYSTYWVMKDLLLKSRKDRVFFGVCGGIGTYISIDSSLIRIIFILGTLFSGSLLFWIYLILALVLKTEEWYIFLLILILVTIE